MKFLTLSLAKCFSNRVTRTKSHNPSRMRRKKGGDNSMKSFAEVKLNILFIISLRSCSKTWLSLKLCKFWWQQCARCRACISSQLINAATLPSERRSSAYPRCLSFALTLTYHFQFSWFSIITSLTLNRDQVLIIFIEGIIKSREMTKQLTRRYTSLLFITCSL